jgi:tetratricopeptide (TPR) repeat protein
MGLIREKSRLRKAAVFFLCLLAAASLYGQTPPVLFSAEVQSIEKKLASPLSPAEKNRVLRDMARLMELSGNVEGAVRAWNEAARTLPSDYDALVRSGACLAALGEFEAALNALKAVIQASAASGFSPGAEPGLRARYLAAQIEAFRSGEAAALSALLPDAAFSAYKPGVYYSIWRISGDAVIRNRLLNEFPQSPEALALKDGSAVSAAPTALWLLGLPSSGALPAPAAGQPERRVSAESTVSPATESGQGPVMLQTGLFGREENAQTLAGRLRNAGFAPIISTKTVNGTAYWAVGVLPGADYNATILLLKDAGFEAFPVY